MFVNSKGYMKFVYSALLCLSAMTFSHSASAADAETGSSCQLIYANDKAEIEVCQVAPQVIWVNAHVIASGKTVTAEFDLESQVRHHTSDRPFWGRLWVATGSPVLTQEEQADLATLQDPDFASTRRFSLEERAAVRSVAKFLVGFVEPGTALESFSQKQSHRVRSWTDTVGIGVTMICEFVGKEHQAEYSVGSDIVRALVLVGAEDSRCRGRCGFGCPFFGGTAGQYTQECLNHDVCHTDRGEQLGECADEFWIAAASYVSAPDCK